MQARGGMLARPPRVSTCRAAPARNIARSRCAVVVVRAGSFQSSVRAYTLRKGDTLETIAKKRGMTLSQLINMNPEMNPDLLIEGQTILLPAGKLSVRDKEILDGIGTSYRLYPMRAGETLTDIISKRKITMEEMQSLNPGLNLSNLSGDTMLKLPANKFTVREREMLMGSGILPPEFFEAARNPFVIGLSGLLGVCGFVLAWMKFHRDEDFDDDLPVKQKS